MKNPIIYILLPVHNRKEVTKTFILGLLRQTWKDYHLILIDDGSIDDTEGMVRSILSDMTVIKGSGDLWWGGSLQCGLDWLKQHNIASDDYVLMINDDVTILPEFLEKGVSFLNRRKRTLLLAQHIDENTGKSIESGVVADLNTQRFEIAKNGKVINCLSTRGLLMRYVDVLEIGEFRPKLLPHYGSDYEYTIRAYKKGFNLLTTSSFSLLINHNETGLHYLPNGGLIEYLKNIFSKRYVENPIYRSTFVILTAPKKRILLLVFKIWKCTLFKIFFEIKDSIWKSTARWIRWTLNIVRSILSNK